MSSYLSGGWRIFQREAPTPRGGNLLLGVIFAKNCMKMKNNELKGGTCPSRPLELPLDLTGPFGISNETFRNLNESPCHIFVLLKSQPCLCFVVENNSQWLKWRSDAFSSGISPQSIHVIYPPSQNSSSLTRHKKVSYFGCHVTEVRVTSEFLSFRLMFSYRHIRSRN